MNEEIKNIQDLFINRITEDEEKNIEKSNLGFIKSYNDFIRQTLSIVCIHCFENFISFAENAQLNIIDMNNTLVYE